MLKFCVSEHTGGIIMTTREFSKPVTFYLDDATYNWLTGDTEVLGLSRSGYLRSMVAWWRQEREAGRMTDGIPATAAADRGDELAAARERIRELEGRLSSDVSLNDALAESRLRISTLEGDVRALEAERDGMQELINTQRERQGMSDSLNQELTTTVNRLTLMLPAAGETSEGRGFNWKFWRR